MNYGKPSYIIFNILYVMKILITGLIIFLHCKFMTFNILTFMIIFKVTK